MKTTETDSQGGIKVESRTNDWTLKVLYNTSSALTLVWLVITLCSLALGISEFVNPRGMSPWFWPGMFLAGTLATILFGRLAYRLLKKMRGL